MVKRKSRAAARAKRKLRKLGQRKGTPERPRLSLFKSAKHLYAQVIDDNKGSTLVSASTLDAEVKTKKRATMKTAKELGELLAKRALQKGLKQILFDRGGHRYHGKLKAFADAAREKGLQF